MLMKQAERRSFKGASNYLLKVLLGSLQLLDQLCLLLLFDGVVGQLWSQFPLEAEKANFLLQYCFCCLLEFAGDVVEFSTLDLAWRKGPE